MTHCPPLRAAIRVEFDHRVYFTRQGFAPANGLLRDVLQTATSPPARALVVLDEALTVARPELPEAIRGYFARHPSELALAGAPLALPAGEAIKNGRGALDEIHAAIARQGLCRHCYVVAIGGGALLDVAGFAAATAHRGLRLVRLPTTTLAQADAGVGVKNGLNAFGQKNFIGAFAVPHAVINDFDLFSPELANLDELLTGLEEFRAHLGGPLTVTMLKGIGEGFEVHEVMAEQVRAAAEELRDLSRRACP